jgi:hypothetical protein
MTVGMGVVAVPVKTEGVELICCPECSIVSSRSSRRAGNGARRIRYRRADLQRMAPVEMISDRPSGRDAHFRWLPAVRTGTRSHAALVCYPNSRVTYDVTLPPCARRLLVHVGDRDRAWRSGNRSRFDIHVRTQGFEAVKRYRVNPASRRCRWHSLSIDAQRRDPPGLSSALRWWTARHPFTTSPPCGGIHTSKRRVLWST